ncbi:MAG TPA: LPXTG cell wall anchor domain-containing protein, partial [Ardenticatenaceae bacterium]
YLPEGGGGGGDSNLLILGFQEPVPTATVLTTLASNATAPQLPLALGAGMLALSTALLLRRRRR